MKTTVVVRNQDGVVIHTETGLSTFARERCEWHLLNITAEARIAINSTSNDREWLATLLDNGFYSIEEGEQ